MYRCACTGPSPAAVTSGRGRDQTADGEAKRDDAHFCYVAAWEWQGPGKTAAAFREPLTFEYVHLAQRSYK